jgi:hypothetical protein
MQGLLNQRDNLAEATRKKKLFGKTKKGKEKSNGLA